MAPQGAKIIYGWAVIRPAQLKLWKSVAQSGLAKVSTHVFCAGGAADISRWRNHRKRVEIYSQPRRGDRPASLCRPSGAPEGVFDCVRWFLHRLISSVPPGSTLSIS